MECPSPSFQALLPTAHVGSVSLVLQAGRPWTALWMSRGVRFLSDSERGSNGPAGRAYERGKRTVAIEPAWKELKYILE